MIDVSTRDDEVVFGLFTCVHKGTAKLFLLHMANLYAETNCCKPQGPIVRQWSLRFSLKLSGRESS